MKYGYLVIVTRGPEDANYSAYAPDLPGCVSAGDTVEETLENFQQALQMHIEGMLEDRETPPSPESWAGAMVEVEVGEPALA